MSNFTATGNTTKTFGFKRCPACGCDRQTTLEFHGYWTTYCDGCGREP